MTSGFVSVRFSSSSRISRPRWSLGCNAISAAIERQSMPLVVPRLLGSRRRAISAPCAVPTLSDRPESHARLPTAERARREVVAVRGHNRSRAAAAPGDDPLAFRTDPPALPEQLRQVDASAAHEARSSQPFRILHREYGFSLYGSNRRFSERPIPGRHPPLHRGTCVGDVTVDPPAGSE
jgi:hypothetical protein